MSTNDEQSRSRTPQEVTLELVREALNGENPLAEKFGEYDDPAWKHALADHVAYRTMKMDGVEELSEREAEEHIDALCFQGKLKRITNDMWLGDKVTLP